MDHILLNHLETHSFPSSTLHDKEVDLLVSVANEFIKKYPESARRELRGSFKLVGRHRSGEIKKIISFDFPGGTNIGREDYNSSDIVNAAIENVIESEDFMPAHSEPSKNKDSDTLFIPTKYGAFVLGISMIPRDLGYTFMLHMAVALRELGRSESSDKRLMFSIDSLRIYSADDRYMMQSVEYAITGNHFSTEEMIEWQRWHRIHSRTKGGELGFFFEEYEKKKASA